MVSCLLFPMRRKRQLNTLNSGVPQGSIPGPFLFSLYMCPLDKISHNSKNFYHLYADDTKLLYILHSKWVLIVLFTSTLLRQGDRWPEHF